MVPAAHIDASYLGKPKARSRAGVHFFLSNNATVPRQNYDARAGPRHIHLKLHDDASARSTSVANRLASTAGASETLHLDGIPVAASLHQLAAP